jgi:hypothetical protein
MKLLHNQKAELKISNIKFSVLQKRTKTLRYDSKSSVNNSVIIEGDHKDLKKELMISRNSFIPTTNIKNQIQFIRERIVHHVPLHPL